jgi:hypothetical protein
MMSNQGQQPLFPRGPNCWQCQYFGLTYEPRLPYLCRLMGIRSRFLPSVEVLRADGRFCHGFVAKPVGAPAPRVATPS